MQLSVIILNYNVRYFLELCVSSVQAALNGIDAEIIVVDNNSTDDSCIMMKAQFSNVNLIENKENSGFPKGNNIGVAQAKGKYICILNPDTVVAEDTFVNVLAFAERQKNLGIVGVKLIDGAGNFLPESKRGIPTPWVAFTKITALYKLFPQTVWFDSYYAGHLEENQTGKVEILVGAFMVMERQLYLDVGGFDEDCFMYSDDIDLSYRVLQRGKTNYYFHETTVIHYKGESTIKDGTYMKRFQEAMNFFYRKHFKVSVLFSIFMKMGIVFFSLVKMFQGKRLIQKEKEHFVLYSKNKSLVQKIETALRKKVVFHDLNTEKMVFSSLTTESPVEILLDANSILFKDSIAFMERIKNKRFTFKILSKNNGFLIGSDTSNERGTIIEISYTN
ncbi:glycosyltransferase family 2 protein [Flavobacterium sp. UMI-01]|uniref:glycosyltransferase family 2 protein n=1 Tax=Flavobacterium sp. UMI-01 TaxID=1441053 RepID=UPI001C7CBC59|nr:glycosyltransferase family 2 protein [Flavobacterium sp. UMI-01]GIZ10030.1 glycosyl transferase family 2 [Flavobacterium sp. UMI-01]